MLFLDFVVISIFIVQTFGAQPRSGLNLINIDTSPIQSLPLVHYSKPATVLQPPVAFSYTQDLRPSETVIKQKRLRYEPPEEIRKLNSKRILKPKKYYREYFKDILPEETKEEARKHFIIYVPEDTHEDDDLVQAPIIVPELSEEELRQVEANKQDISQVEPSKHDDISSAISVDSNLEDKQSLVDVLGARDQKVQESHHKKHKPKPKPKDTKYEKGDGKSAEAKHHKSHKDKGNKGYKGEHQKHKVEKAHHVDVAKADHHEDKGGDKKDFHHEDDLYAEHEEEDDGHKASKFEEDGENDKGHTTQGTHNVNKKEEYVKKIEFFDEYHEDSDQDEDGGHEDDQDFKKGHHDHKEHHDSAYKHDDYADEKDDEDTHHYKYIKGKHHKHKHDDHHDYDDKNAKKSNHESKKIWKVVITEGDNKEHKSQ